MRFRISIRSALIATALIAFILAAGLFAYREYIVPNTPLSWGEFDSKRLDSISETSHPILISMKDLTLTSQPDLQYYLEYESDHSPNLEFRRFIHRHKIELLSFTLNNQGHGQQSANALSQLLIKQNPDIEEDILLTPLFDPESEEILLIPHFILALPGKKRLLVFPEQFPDADDIMAAVLSNGEIARGEEFFPDRYE